MVEDEIEVEDGQDEDVLEHAMGKEDLELLKKFYLTSAEMSDDNEELKKKQKKRKSQADIWSVILKEYELYCPSLAKVIELMLVIPSSTAEVERFFKILKEMRSKKRNRLSAKKLRKLFLIYHFLDLEQYDRERVHELFLKHLQRWFALAWTLFLKVCKNYLLFVEKLPVTLLVISDESQYFSFSNTIF